MKKNLLLLLLLLPLSTFSQTLDHQLGGLIVKLNEKTNLHQFQRDYVLKKGNKDFKVEILNHDLGIYLLRFNPNSINEEDKYNWFTRNSMISEVQYNHFISFRNTPDDPLFMDQWQYINDSTGMAIEFEHLNAEKAWDIGTGGVTVFGDTIVTCVIDDGINLSHEDLQGNLWKNYQEMPGNGIDDDGNGYIDDFHGWNVNLDNDNLTEGGNHGTPVAGIIGAKGNNGIGRVGVNWDAKIMVVKSGAALESDIIKSYSYPYSMRKLYNDTDGEKGAFVVATNASWGIDNGFPSEAPIWCGFYDELGKVGILNCGATSNSNINVDVEGDLPTLCVSEHLIAVTNLGRDNVKALAGFGQTSIDLGAYGKETQTLSKFTYGSFGGTSGATPHVTGAIALLYSADCPTLTILAKNDPEAASLLARDYILNNVVHNESLEGITVTEGRLDLFASMQAVMDDCGSCLGPFRFEPSMITDSSFTINWVNYVEAIGNSFRYKEKGTADWTEFSDFSESLDINGLASCTEYEFEFKSECDSMQTEYMLSSIVKTEGCCENPEKVNIISKTENEFEINWDPVYGIQNYTLQLKDESGNIFVEEAVDTNYFKFENLSGCNNYSLSFKSNCGNNSPVFGENIQFTTLGCGSCYDFEYCVLGNGTNTDEYIASIAMNGFSNVSGKDEHGYGDYTGDAITMNKETPIDFRFDITYSGFSYDEAFTIYIDLNQNGEFETEELIYYSPVAVEDFDENSFSLPDSIPNGITRMRIGLNWVETSDSISINELASPCNNPDFGEVEDYCVLIQDFGTGTNEFSHNSFEVVVNNPFIDILNVQFELNNPDEIDVQLIDIKGVIVKSEKIVSSQGINNITLDTKSLKKGLYFLVLRNKDSSIVTKLLKSY